jgi:hypothetical protein
MASSFIAGAIQRQSAPARSLLTKDKSAAGDAAIA